LVAFNADESLNEQATRQHVRFLLDAGVHGLVPLASAGEFVALTEKERMRVVEWTLAETSGKVPVYVGAAHFSTRITIELSSHAKQHGAAGLMLMPPYLMRPPKRDVLDHFRRVREAVGLPIMLDNVPLLAGLELTTAEIKQLADDDVIHGVKWSHPEVSRIQDTKLICRPDFAVFVGMDMVGFAGLAVGAEGYMGGLAMMTPRLARTLYGAFREKQDLSTARQLWNRLLPLVQFEYRGLVSETGQPHWLAVWHEAAALRGIPVGSPRAPIRPLYPDQKAELRRLLTELGEL
jgi:4-hydroxy-tetrahydrodipicolinate synthase